MRIYHAAGPDMGYAKGTFNPEEFAKSPLGREVQEMKSVFYKHEHEPDHPEVIEYWESLGVKQEIFDADTPPEKEQMFNILRPLNQKAEGEYPLIYCLHGGGETAFGAEFYGYGEMVSQGECIAVFPTASCHGNEHVESEFVRILAFLKDNNYPIDYTRVYVAGFSGGEGATQRIAMLHADKIAAIAPTPGPNSFRGESLGKLQKEYIKKFNLQIPVICLGGSEDGGDSWPLNTVQCVQAFNFYMTNVAKVLDFRPLSLEEMTVLAKDSKNTVNRLFGLEFDETWIQNFNGQYVYLGEYYGNNGYAVARFGSVIGLPHVQCRIQSKLIWEYLKSFSRDLNTGESIFTVREINGATK